MHPAGVLVQDKCDGFQWERDAKSMMQVIAQMSQFAHAKVLFRAVLKTWMNYGR